MRKEETLKQPNVFYMACISSMFERFGFYTLSFLLVLFLKAQLHLTDYVAFALFAIFNALVYITPAIGGYLADNIIGIRRAIIIGLVLEASGLTLLSFQHPLSLTLSLALIIIGVGFFRTGPTNLMARSYTENDPRIDSGFTWYYMIMNIGSLIAPISAGFIQHYYSWHVAFTSGAIIIWFSLLVYFFMRHSAKKDDSSAGEHPLKKRIWILLFSGAIVSCFAVAYLIEHAIIADIFFVIASASIFLYFLYEIIKSPKDEKLKIIACLLLILVGMAFFLLYFQIFTSMTLYIKRCIVHKIFGFYVPTAVFQMLNPFWILLLSPLLASAYSYLGKRKKDLPVTLKFPLGLFFGSLTFFILAASTFFPNSLLRISPLWLVAGIGSLSLGELLISALGVAMVTRIAPERMYGIMMGSWYLIACAIASSLSGKVASLTSVPQHVLTNQSQLLRIYGHGFIKMGLIGVATTAIAFAIGPYIKRIANL